MATASDILPDLATLTAGLTALLRDRHVNVVDRQWNDYASGSPSETVTCRLSDGSERQLFCKYGACKGLAGDDGSFKAETWADVAYEVEIYRDVLQPLGLSTPAFVGSYQEAPIGRTWLLLEHVQGTTLDLLLKPEIMAVAARWLGHFHAQIASRLARGPIAGLKMYDPAYYLGYARRAVQSEALTGSHPWLLTLGRRFEDFLPPLWARRPTVSHGDYYLHNILVQEDRICPIDWESAGIDLGEMDLACLIDGWWEDTAQECEQSYCQGRWPEGAPPDFAQALAAARLCLGFYNLASAPGTADDAGALRLVNRLREIGQRAGLI